VTVSPRADLVVLRTFPNRIEAELAQGALAAKEIPSVISADDAGGVEPNLWVRGIRLLVQADSVTDANAVLGPAR
jgi:hypothetical protein